MLRFNPPLYFLMGLLLSIALHFAWPVSGLIDWPFRWVGLLLIALGGWVTVWGDGVFKRAGTTVKPSGKPTALVAVGPFRISRHPMYLGMTALVFGVAVLLGSVMAFLGPILFWTILQFVFIPYEESKMRSIFGESYDEYRKSTRMWLWVFMSDSLHASIVKTLKRIPPGRVATYGQIAALSGNPRAARQVVRALHNSSAKEHLPWFRVINARGCISLPRGAGFEEQCARLNAEGVTCDAGGRIDLSRFQWRPRS